MLEIACIFDRCKARVSPPKAAATLHTCYYVWTSWQRSVRLPPKSKTNYSTHKNWNGSTNRDKQNALPSLSRTWAKSSLRLLSPFVCVRHWHPLENFKFEWRPIVSVGLVASQTEPSFWSVSNLAPSYPKMRSLRPPARKTTGCNGSRSVTGAKQMPFESPLLLCQAMKKNWEMPRL